MSNIILLYEKASPTSVQLYNELLFLKEPYAIEIRNIKIHETTLDDLLWSDVVIVIRGTSSIAIDLARMAKRLKRILALFYDDDLLNLPNDVITSKIRRSTTAKCLPYADLIISTNAQLCKDYAILIPSNRSVLRNTAIKSDVINPYSYSLNGNQKIKIVYAANKGHVTIFNHYILPLMPEFCDKFGKSVSLTFIGVRPDLKKYEDKIEVNYVESMPLDKYRNHIREGNFDIGIAPLFEDEFSKRKHYNKYLEYSIAGIFGIYSDTEPYTHIVKNHYNGLLAANTKEGWMEAFTEAIENTYLRQQCVSNAQKVIREKFNEKNVNERFVHDFPEIISYKAPKVDLGNSSLVFARIRYRVFSVIDRMSLVYLYTRESGLHGMIEKVINHFQDR